MALTDTLQFHAATDVGRKRNLNEDNYLVDRDLGLFVVADGMGGHAAGEVASAMAVRTIHEVVRHERGLIQDRAINGPRSEVGVRQILGVLELAVQSASQKIHVEAQRDAKKRGMGTTVSLLLLIDGVAYIAHVGDSRVYLLRDGYLHRVTEDHTVANELLRLGMVTPEQLDRVPRKNAITRAVGVYQHIEIDTLTLEALPNDQFLLCSDGLHGYFDETGEDLRSYLAGDDGDEVVKRLVDFANEKGGKDNITGLLVRLGGGDNSDSLRARRVAMKREMLAGLPLFSRLSERELLHVLQVADVVQYEAGEHVVRAGEHGDQMFVALDGKLRVMSGKATLQELGPGDHFGEMALIRNVPRSADVVAIGPSEVVSIRRADFFEIIRSEPHIAVKLLWQFLGVLANRLERTSHDLSQAREQLGMTAPSPTWVDEEPSLDPFSARPIQAALSSMGIRLDDLPGGKNHNKQIKHLPPKPDEAVEQRADAPPFERAPQLAHRIEDPPSFDSGSGSDHAGSAQHLERMAARSESTEDDAFDARSTRPRTKLSDRERKTLKMSRDDAAPDPAMLRRPPEGPVEKRMGGDYDAKRTLPSQPSMPKAGPNMAPEVGPKGGPERSPAPPPPRKPSDSKATLTGHGKPSRPRVETLQSAGAGTLPGGIRRLPPKSPPPDVPDDEPTAAQGDGKSTRPDGGLRAARDDAASEKRTIDISTSARPPVEGEDGFRPTKVTIPLDPPDALKSELDELRKEFKERLRKSREAREQRGGRKDSD